MVTQVTLSEAVDLARTGDVWLFRGRSGADRTIQTLTNSPVNHVGMALVLDDLPPLMWHAELGRSLPDVWAGEHRRGAQLHDLRAAVEVWSTRYGQRAWFRQLEPEADRAAEDAALRVVARMDGTPFPSTTGLAARWVAGRRPVLRFGRRGRTATTSPAGPLPPPQAGPTAPGDPDADARSSLETAFCAEIVAMTYQAMGLLPTDRSPSWYDPGRFWSGDDLELGRGARLGEEIAVRTAG
jgi:hypothetical protein